MKETEKYELCGGSSSNPIIACIMQSEVPTKEENHRLVEEVKKGSKEATEELVIRNGRLVLSFLKKYRWLDEYMDDLLQEGLIGIQVAAQKFDLNYGTAFSTYATVWIHQHISVYLRENIKAIKLPTDIVSKITKIKKIEDRARENGLPVPSDEEIAREVGVSVDVVSKFRMYDAYNTAISSLDTPLEDSDSTVAECIPSDEGDFTETIIDREINGEVLEVLEKILSEKEFDIIKMLCGLCEYSHKYTQVQIAKKYGVSKQMIGQTKNNARKKMKRNIRLKKLLGYDMM